MICTKDIVRLDYLDSFSMDLDDGIVTKQKNSNTFILENGKQLLQCAREGDSRGVVELLSKGAPITSDWLGTSPLHLAVMNNHYETCEVLLRAGVSKDGRTKVDRTPLHFAAYDGYYLIAKLLLKHGADVDCRDMLQMTPLHWAVERGHKECVKVLLSSGAKADAVSRFNKTPLSIALDMNWSEVIQMLQKSSLLEATQNLNAEYDEMKEAVHKLTNEFDHEPLKLSNDKTDSTILNDLENDSIDVEKDVQNVFASLLPQVDESPNEATLQLLKEHGIMMLPADSTNTVNSAIQSGRKVVLSDAGKLVLKDVNFQKDPPKPIEIKRKPIILPSTKMKSAKIFTVTSSQFLAMTGGKPNILQKIPESIKTTPFMQLQKNINLSPVKISPYSSNIKIVSSSMPAVKTVPDTLVKNSNNLLSPSPAIATIKGGDIVKVNQMKNSRIIKYTSSNTNLSKPVKIVIKKNNIAKQLSNLPESISKVINCDTTTDKEIPSEEAGSPLIDNFTTLNERISLTNNTSNEVERLKSELALARIEIEYFKKKYEETHAELIVYKNKLNCHSLMELETNSID